MHKNDFFPFIFFSYHSFSLSYLEPQIIFPCRDIGPATATLDPRPRLWTRDRDFGPATATVDPRPATRDPRPATISQTRWLLKFSFRAWQKYCILFLLSLDRFSEGLLINTSSKKIAVVRVFTPTIRHFETGLFKKSGKIR